MMYYQQLSYLESLKVVISLFEVLKGAGEDERLALPAKQTAAPHTSTFIFCPLFVLTAIRLPLKQTKPRQSNYTQTHNICPKLVSRLPMLWTHSIHC